jgi:hypothetical protein
LGEVRKCAIFIAELQLMKPATLTPSMETEVEGWLKTVGVAWAHSQEEKHRVPVDAWLAQIHHLTRPYSKLAGGLNSWNSYQKWWKHHHPEEECPLGSDDGGRHMHILLFY